LSEEDRQLAHVLSTLIWASWGVYLVVIFTGLYYADWRLITVTLAGCILLVAPLILLKRRQLRASSLVVVLIEIAIVTFIAMVGQGIRDLAIIAFPIILIFAGLSLNRGLFRFCVGLILAAVCWLAFGEANGWFILSPFTGEAANWFYLIAIIFILSFAGLAVDLLTTNMRQNLELARQEIAQRKRAEEILQASEARYRRLVENSPDIVYTFSNKRGGIYYSPRIEQVLGYSVEYLYSHPQLWNESVHPDDRDKVDEIIREFEIGKLFDIEYRVQDAQGNWRWLRDRSTGHDVGNGEVLIEGLVTDITERKCVEDVLLEKEVQYRNLADSGIALIWTSGTDKLCNYFNLPWLTFTGRTLEQELGNGWAEGVHPDDFDRCLEIYTTAFDKREVFDMDYRLRHVSGEYRWIRDLGTPNYNSNGEFIGYIGHCFDITERKRLEEELRYQGTHDVLTGLYNRAFFETEMARLEHNREIPTSIIMADMDQLKAANDTWGHAAGDELLRQTATLLRSIFREGDVLARIGGDEFAVLLPTTDSATAEQMLARVKKQLAEHNAEHPDLPVQLSLGMATAEKNNLTEAFRVADRRMYSDKAARKAKENHLSQS